MRRSYGWLTHNFKQIWTRFCHEWCATRRLDRARESFEASNAKWRMRRVGPRLRLDPLSANSQDGPLTNLGSENK
jgi:hypothetical protein